MADEEFQLDEYELVNCVATGSASQIWEVRQKGNPESLAVKLLLPEAFGDAELKAVLKHEARVHKSLEHPNFLKFHKLVADRRHAYIVMEYFRAPNLKMHLHADALAVHVRIRRLMEGVCLALQAMHDAGWVHRDIKPDNILFSKSSELRLIDFSLSTRAAGGLSRMLGARSKTIQGTRTYIAPETIRRQGSTPQTDMYSLGITLYEVLTGQPPFKGSSPNDLLRKHLAVIPAAPADLNPNVTPELSRIVMRLLSKKPANRYKTMNELYAELRTVKPFREDVQEMAARAAEEADRARKESLQAAHDKLDSRADHQRSQEFGEGISSGEEETAAQPPPAAPPKPQPKPAAPAAPTPAASASTPAMPPGQMPPGQMPPGQMPPGQMPPGQMPPGQMPQPPGGYPPGYGPPPGYVPLPPGQGGPPGQPGWNWPQGVPPQQMPWPAGAPAPAAGMPPGMPPQGAPGQAWPPGYPQPGANPAPQAPPAPGGPPSAQPPVAPAAGQPQAPPAAQPPSAPAPAAPASQQPPEEPDDLPLMDELPDVM